MVDTLYSALSCIVQIQGGQKAGQYMRVGQYMRGAGQYMRGAGIHAKIHCEMLISSIRPEIY